MGQYSTANLVYGFVLKQPQLSKLVEALNERHGCETNSSEVEESDVEEISEQLGKYVQGGEASPYLFCLDTTGTQDTDDEHQLLIYYDHMEGGGTDEGNNEDEDESDEMDADDWSVYRGGYEPGKSFKPLGNTFPDPKFVEEAKGAMQKIRNIEIFKKAGFTEKDIDPQWIICVSYSF